MDFCASISSQNIIHVKQTFWKEGKTSLLGEVLLIKRGLEWGGQTREARIASKPHNNQPHWSIGTWTKNERSILRNILEQIIFLSTSLQDAVCAGFAGLLDSDMTFYSARWHQYGKACDSQRTRVIRHTQHMHSERKDISFFIDDIIMFEGFYVILNWKIVTIFSR